MFQPLPSPPEILHEPLGAGYEKGKEKKGEILKKRLKERRRKKGK
jgi:hypothetical protein